MSLAGRTKKSVSPTQFRVLPTGLPCTDGLGGVPPLRARRFLRVWPRFNGRLTPPPPPLPSYQTGGTMKKPLILAAATLAAVTGVAAYTQVT